MAGSVGSLGSLSTAERQSLLHFLLSGEGVPSPFVRSLIAKALGLYADSSIQDQVSPFPGGFAMIALGSDGYFSLVKAIEALPVSARRLDVRRVADACIAELVPNEGRVALDRAGIAHATGLTVNIVSSALTHLERLGFLRRVTRQLEAGGVARLIYVNPDIAWNGSLPRRLVALERYRDPKGFDLPPAPRIKHRAGVGYHDLSLVCV